MSELVALIEKMKSEHYWGIFLPNPPITMAEIEEAEQELPFSLPAFYKSFLLIANGGEFSHDTFFGIYPKDKKPEELLHPRTLKQIEIAVANPHKSGWFTQRYHYTVEGLMAYTDLVKMSDPEYLCEMEIYSEDTTDQDLFIVVGGVDTGDMYIVKRNDETLYLCEHDNQYLPIPSPWGSLAERLQQHVDGLNDEMAGLLRYPTLAKSYLRFLDWYDRYLSRFF